MLPSKCLDSSYWVVIPQLQIPIGVNWFSAADLKENEAWPHQALPWQSKSLLNWKQKACVKLKALTSGTPFTTNGKSNGLDQYYTYSWEYISYSFCDYFCFSFTCKTQCCQWLTYSSIL